MSNNNVVSYNSFDRIEEFPYNIITHLMINGNEGFWKVLKYDTARPLDEDDLTLQEKKDLLWTGVDDISEVNNRLFLKQLLHDALTEDKTVVKLYELSNFPVRRTEAIMSFRFEIITSSKIPMVYNERGVLCSRISLLERMLLEDLNGVDVGSVGRLSFDREMTRDCKAIYSINNSVSFYGIYLVFGLRHMKIKKGEVCNG